MKPLAGSDGERDTAVVIVASVPSQRVSGVLRWSYVGGSFSSCRGWIVWPGRVCLDTGIRQV